jgi:hypothetical protein
MSFIARHGARDDIRPSPANYRQAWGFLPHVSYLVTLITYPSTISEYRSSFVRGSVCLISKPPGSNHGASSYLAVCRATRTLLSDLRVLSATRFQCQHQGTHRPVWQISPRAQEKVACWSVCPVFPNCPRPRLPLLKTPNTQLSRCWLMPVLHDVSSHSQCYKTARLLSAGRG